MLTSAPISGWSALQTSIAERQGSTVLSVWNNLVFFFFFLMWTICTVCFESWASLIAQLVKNLHAMQETPVRSLGWEDPLQKA